ncbi:MAG TPA: serine hydrolase [Jatrophihabitans sp.]|nr:serine hydrolase [Jatrophihabitans sp.]
MSRGLAAALALATLTAACEAAAPTATPTQTPLQSSSIATTQVAVPSATTTRPPPNPRHVATHKLRAIARRLPKHAISVEVVNLHNDATYRWGARRGMWTGSVYKLFVLEAMLLERQRTASWFSSYELADITAMIEQSDNAAGYRMYLDAGGSPGLAAAANRLGLRHTRIGVADPALTTMDARDGITLLRHLVAGGLLNAHSKSFVLRLMRSVQDDQRWGVGVVADRGTTFANKNGWMEVTNNGPGEDDDGRWLVNSLGIVRVHGQRLLMAIFTRHDPDYDTGADLVQRLARIITPVVTPT